MSEETKEEVLEVEDTEIIEHHDDDDHKKLNLKDIIYLFVIGLVSTILFFILLFPLEEVIRSITLERTRKAGIILDFKNLNFPIFGTKSLDNFLFQNATGLVFKSEEVEFQISLLGLMLNKLEIEQDFLSSSIETKFANWNPKSSNLNLSLENFDKPSKWNGDIVFLSSGGKISDLHDIPMLTDLKDIKINKFSLFLKFKYGKGTIDKGNIDSSVLKGSLSGSVKLMDAFALSPVDLKFCFNFTEAFSLERPDIAGYAAILPKEGNKSCIPIIGTLGNLKVGVQLQQEAIQSE